MDTKRNRWSESEINFLVENYKDKGLIYATEILINHTRGSIIKKAKKLGICVNLGIYSYNLDQIVEAVKTSYSYKDVFRKLNKSASGDAYNYLRKFIKKNNIDTSHFDPWKHNRVNIKAKSISEYLQIGTIIGSRSLKDKLYKEGLKERKCELCGQGEDWNGKHMSLILDHKNGVNNDNRLDNLRIVCPNCNATLDTHCKGFKG